MSPNILVKPSSDVQYSYVLHEINLTNVAYEILPEPEQTVEWERAIGGFSVRTSDKRNGYMVRWAYSARELVMELMELGYEPRPGDEDMLDRLQIWVNREQPEFDEWLERRMDE